MFLSLIPYPAWAQPRTGALRPTVFVLRDARVVTEPGQTLEKATIVLRDGLIEAVGTDVKVPADALVIDGKGLVVYPGFVDALSHRGYDSNLRRSEAGPPAPEDLTSEALAATKPDNRKGITPEFEISSALKADAESIDNWRRLGFTAQLVAPEGGIITGQSALVSLSTAPPREALLRSNVAQHISFRTVGGGDYPRVLMGVIAHSRQTLLDAGHYQRVWKAFEDAGRSGRRPPLDPALAALAPALDGKQPVIFEADRLDWIEHVLDFAAEFRLRPILYGGKDAWKVADRLAREQVPVILRLNFTEEPTGEGDERPSEPGMGRRRGGGASSELLPARVKEERQRLQKEEMACAARLHQKGIRLAFSTQGLDGDKPWEKFQANLRKAIAAGLPAEAALRALTSDAAGILGAGKQLGRIAPGRTAHLVVLDGKFEEASAQVRYVFADGIRFEFESKPKAKEEKKPDPKKETGPKKPAGPEIASEIEVDRQPKLRTGGNVLIRKATVLPVCGPTLTSTDVLVLKGKIAAIGKDLKAPEGVLVVDAPGMYLMPGIIDTHSHIAVSGGVNEFSLSVVPEVRITDVLDSEDVDIYRALAGGVTTIRILHGSANVIGGQDAVVKLKYGEPASKMLVTSGPRGVKFALGENVKRTDGRFPNTRLGVEAVLIRAFTEAQAYRKTWDDYLNDRKAGKPAIEPRRDLRLEALADVLRGDLKVHCHCYRSDEILMLLRVADRFGFKVQSLQHVLEGYKIAPEIAEHGASCSTFSDWWAYKIEAYDAIPFNSALLHQAGASVCIKSDSRELMRHLYQEAAKCIKYGGMSEIEALKTITLNAARQLGLDKRLGSIETGKDADLVLFNGHPLNSLSRVEMTLVDGEVYFQRPTSPGRTDCQSVLLPLAELPLVEQIRSDRYWITNVTVHPVTGPVIEKANVYIDRGRIGRIVKAESIPGDEPRLDARGLHLYPGMIDAASVLGLTELGSARETHDYAEGGDFQPDLRASVAINPDSELIPVTRANGVTTVVTRPSGSIIAGQSALINLNGWVPREMTLLDPLALHIDFPTARPTFSGDPTVPMVGRAIARKQREEKLRRLKELFQQALAYEAGRKESSDRPSNPRLEALVPYALGQKPVIIQANREREIREALKLADEFKLKLILSGGLEAWKVTEELKKRQTPVIVGPIMTMPQENHDPYDSPFTCPLRLHEAGVPFCIRSTGTTNTRNLPYEAAMAASYGLPAEEALKAVTLYPAKILGLGDQLGSIEVGKRANLVLTNGDLLQASAQVAAVIINGKPLSPASKHTRLYERYRERLKEVKEGKAPLGTR